MNHEKNQKVSGTFIVASIEEKQSSKGPYLAGRLQTKYGVIPFKFWNQTMDRDGYAPGTVLNVEAVVDVYEGKEYLVVRYWEVALDTSYDMADLIPHSPIPSDVLWSDMLAHIQRIGDDGLREWLVAFVGEREKQFRMAPAAMTMHHAYAGGLLEHIGSLARAAENIVLAYEADLDILIAAAVLHDVGKLWELESSPVLDYTTVGNLIGHVCIGVSVVSHSIQAWNKTAIAMASNAAADPNQAVRHCIPDHTRLHILHIIASHHGEAEKGAARPPATLEAIIFHHLDMIDSRAWMVAQHLAGDKSEGVAEFTSFNRGLNVKLWRTSAGLVPVMVDPDGD